MSKITKQSEMVDMPIIHFTANHQTLSINKNDIRGIIKGTRGYYTAYFDLTDDYTGCKVAAEFSTKAGQYYVGLVNNTCMIPNEVSDADRYSVKLIAQRSEDYQITTSKVFITQGA